LEDGYGKIVGRMKDLIIRTGDKIFPTEIEDFFMEHPDILEAQVKYSALSSAHKHKHLPKSQLNTVKPVLNGILMVQNIFLLKPGFRLIKLYYDSHGT
jgi:hypothetical protein